MINRILALIDNSDMSDSAICRELSIGNGIIGKWRKGLQKPSTEAIIKIAQYFQVSTDFLLLGNDYAQTNILTLDDAEWLSIIHRLPEKKQIEFKSKMEGYLECYEESVAADKSSQKTGTTNSAK